MQLRGVVVGLVLAGVVGAGCSSSKSSSSSDAAVACDTKGAAATATTATYKFVVDIGPMEQMFDQSQAAGKPAGSGEVMLGGSMTDASGPTAQHLEVHICKVSDGSVVAGAQPTITLTDKTAGTPAMNVDVAVMQGVGETQADLHYGNNVLAPAGHSFVVNVTLGGEQATLPFTR